MAQLLGNCRTCGYSLVKLSAPRCPECGTPFDPADPSTMDFNRPRWTAFLQKPTTVRTWIPALVAAAYLLLAVFVLPANPVVSVLAAPAVLIVLATWYIVSVRRRLDLRLRKYAAERSGVFKR